MNSKYILILLLAVVSKLGFAQFRFNEYSCSNLGAVQDPLGAGNPVTSSPDWVEIRTNSSILTQLSGWYISDDRNNLHKWQIPYYNNQPIKLDSNTHQLIYLCGHNKSVASSSGTQAVDLHTNFQIDQTRKGTTLYLTKVNTTLISDSVVIKRLEPDHSWGKWPNYNGTWRLYTQSSPGTRNIGGQYNYFYPNPSDSTIFDTLSANYYIDYTPTPKLMTASTYVGSGFTLTIKDTTNRSLQYANRYWTIFATTDCTSPLYSPLLTCNTSTVNATGVFPPQGTGTTDITLDGITTNPCTNITDTVTGIIVQAVIQDTARVPAYWPGFPAYGAYIIDSTYHMAVTCTCLDTVTLNNSTAATDTGYAIVDCIGINHKEQFKNVGQFFYNKIDFDNKPGVSGYQWQWQLRAEDEYGYNYTNKADFYIDNNLGITNRREYPELTFRSAAEENFLKGGAVGANRMGPTHMRDFYNHTYNLRHNSNFESSHYVPTYLFVNGKNRGIYYIKEPIDSNYTSYYYDYPHADIIVNDITPTTTTARVNHVVAGKLTNWFNFYNWVMSPATSMHVPTIYERITDSLDVNSFIDYTIYNMLSVNLDYQTRYALWWKGRPADTLDKRASKWRFGLTNTDMTWGYWAHNYNNIDRTPYSDVCSFLQATGIGPYNNPGKPLGSLFYKLCENDTFNTAFLTRYQDLVNTKYSCDSLEEHLKYLRPLLKSDMPSQVYWYAHSNSSCSPGPCPDSVHYWNVMVDSMNAFIAERCSLVMQSIQNINSCSIYNGPFNLCVNVFPDNAGYVKLNSLTLKNFTWNGKYLDSVLMTAIPIADTNYVFDHWETTPSNYTLYPNDKTDTVHFYVSKNVCIKAVFRVADPNETYGEPLLPTAFSPNGDGYNDILNVYGIANATSYDLDIYDRWGQRLFHSTDKNQGWDGNYNNSPVPVGVYAYRYQIVIKGKTYTKKGSFTLLR